VKEIIAVLQYLKEGKKQVHKLDNNDDEDVILFAAADCTGHGVPGAMDSATCNNGMNPSVREYGGSDRKRF
jgi:hypothetical protein